MKRILAHLAMPQVTADQAVPKLIQELAPVPSVVEQAPNPGEHVSHELAVWLDHEVRVEFNRLEQERITRQGPVAGVD